MEILCNLEARNISNIPLSRAHKLYNLAPCMFVSKAWNTEVYKIRKINRLWIRISRDISVIRAIIQKHGKEKAVKMVQVDPRWCIANLKECIELDELTDTNNAVPLECSFQYMRWWLDTFPRSKFTHSQILSVRGLGLEVYEWAVAKNAIKDHYDPRTRPHLMISAVVQYNRLDVIENDAAVHACVDWLSIYHYGSAITQALVMNNEIMAEKILDLYIHHEPDRNRTPKFLAREIKAVGGLGWSYTAAQNAADWLIQKQKSYLRTQILKRKRKRM